MVKTATAIAGVAIAAGAGILAIALLPKAGASSTNLTVTVDVTDATTNDVIVGAAVLLGEAGLSTDESGSAVFEGVAASPYLLTVEAAGYEVYSENVTVSSSETIPVQLVETSVCTPQKCAANQYWDQASCSCVNLTPGSIIAPPDQTVNLAWMVVVKCLSNTFTVGILPDNPLTCPGAVTPPNWPTPNVWTLEAQGQVLDSSGKPLPDTTVAVSMQTILPWTAGPFTGYMDFILNSPTVTTDSGGNFTAEIIVELNPEGVGNNFGDCLGGSASGATSIVNPIAFRVPGTAVQALTNLTVELLMCGNYLALA